MPDTKEFTGPAYTSVRNALAALPAGIVSEEFGLMLGARTAFRKKRRQEAIELARDAFRLTSTESPTSDRVELARLLSTLKLHSEAFDLLKPLVSAQYVCDDTYRLLECARRSGADGFILSYCRALREHGVADPKCVDLELSYLERYNGWREAVAATEKILAAATDDEFARILRLRRSLIPTYSPAWRDELKNIA